MNSANITSIGIVGTPENWLSFWGSYIGACATAIIIYITVKQHKELKLQQINIIKYTYQRTKNDETRKIINDIIASLFFGEIDDIILYFNIDKDIDYEQIGKNERRLGQYTMKLLFHITRLRLHIGADDSAQESKIIDSINNNTANLIEHCHKLEFISGCLKLTQDGVTRVHKYISTNDNEKEAFNEVLKTTELPEIVALLKNRYMNYACQLIDKQKEVNANCLNAAALLSVIIDTNANDLLKE